MWVWYWELIAKDLSYGQLVTNQLEINNLTKFVLKNIKNHFSFVKLVCTQNLQNKGGFYDQLSTISYYRIEKALEKVIILSTPRLNNLISMIIGIIFSQSVVLSKISQQSKDCYSLDTEESKIKRLQRFLSNNLYNIRSYNNR